MKHRTPTRILATFLAFALVGCLTGDAGESGPPAAGKPRHTNRLAKETSPYLLMHAHNPVDWYPWGPEAFEKARKEGKLVFLSVGYSSCYWCHVMARESFENEAVAKLLNQWFVCIKVDREERPDIDHIYMTALQTFHEVNRIPGGGGWPMSMFLTADGKPIAGGTYWPADDREVDGEKAWGFKSIVKNVHAIYVKDPKRVEKDAERLAAFTRQALEGAVPGVALVDLNRKLVEAGVEALGERFDKTYGGFGSPARKFRGPKFPTVTDLEFLLQQAGRTKSAEVRNMVTLTLDSMARGGIHDQLGGGFHRYATERTWTVPHFEKMLYDNAQLAEVYARAYRATKNSLYRRTVEDILAYVKREMMSPEGSFYSSQDAETNHEEGRFYVWTDREIDAALRDKAENKLARQVFGADGPPNFEKEYHILTRYRPLAALAAGLKTPEDELRPRVAAVRRKLFEARARRPHPFVNRSALTAWSGLMIAGFAETGRALGEPVHVETAARAAEFVLKHQLTKEGRLLRTYAAQPGKPPAAQGPAYLEDYAFLVHGLLALHEATGRKTWLDRARALTDTMIRYHGDRKAGGYYFTANDHEKLFARSKDQYDGATPSGNSMALYNLVRLWQRTGEERYRAEAERGFKAFAGSMKAAPAGLTTMLRALDAYLSARQNPAPRGLPKEKARSAGSA
jgi:uncharacterized protein YyaL (SSP411 family)